MRGYEIHAHHRAGQARELFLPMRGYEEYCCPKCNYEWRLFLPMRGYELTAEMSRFGAQLQLFLPMRGYELDMGEIKPNFTLVISPHEGL